MIATRSNRRCTVPNVSAPAVGSTTFVISRAGNIQHVNPETERGRQPESTRPHMYKQICGTSTERFCMRSYVPSCSDSQKWNGIVNPHLMHPIGASFRHRLLNLLLEGSSRLIANLDNCRLSAEPLRILPKGISNAAVMHEQPHWMVSSSVHS